MAVVEITYFIADAGFKQKFALKENGADLALNLITGVNVVWHFLDSDGAKTSITFDGTPTGSPVLNEAGFDVPTGFFTKEDDYICSIELSDSGILIKHSIENFIVHILKPADA